MENKRNLVAAAIIVILLLAVIIGTAIYLITAFKGRINLFNGRSFFPFSSTRSIFPAASPTVLPTLKPNPSILGTNTTSNSPTNSPTPTNPQLQIYQGSNFQLSYPKNWGVLTCNNSINIELDPYNSSNQPNYPCDFAIKPVTFLVGVTGNCLSEQTIKLGESSVIKLKQNVTSGVNYHWCVKDASLNFDITHRVNSTGSRATSKDDFSSQVEQIISSIKVAGG
ncbi:hypothetical protein HY025_01560 [Candidatus Daviesbacteria bacterium]|nr:hypothetical protein [Candidatus Daviesbacteria bacterium]